jgi:hypothetical protein
VFESITRATLRRFLAKNVQRQIGARLQRDIRNWYSIAV